MIFATNTDGENPGPSGKPKISHKCLPSAVVDGLKAFQATEGSTENFLLMFGVESVPWPTAANKVDKLYQNILDAAGRLMVRWHAEEVKNSKRRHVSGIHRFEGKEKGGGRSRTAASIV